MDKRINSACGKKVIRKLCQQLRNQHRVICVDLIHCQTKLTVNTGQFGDRHVGNFRTCATSGRHRNKRTHLTKRYFPSKILLSTCISIQHKNLRHINDRSASDGNDSVTLCLSKIRKKRINHYIRRFTCAIFALIFYMGF